MLKESSVNGNGATRIWRFVYDSAVLLFIIGLSFYAGQLTQRVESLDRAVSTRGGVQISMEADRRLGNLETSLSEVQRRLEAIDRTHQELARKSTR